MTTWNTAFQSQTTPHKPGSNSAFMMRVGPREVRISKDFRKRFYRTNPVIECRAGLDAGHVEVLLLRKWLVVFSRAQH